MSIQTIKPTYGAVRALPSKVGGTLQSRPTINPATVPVDILTRIKRGTQKLELIPWVLITVGMAEQIMTLNQNNRKFMKTEGLRLSEAMSAEKWIFIGDVIRVSSEMKLIDGQHKLWAIIHSGKSQRLHIQCGLNPKAFAVIDTGKKRTAGMTLGAMKVPNANVTAAAIKAYIYFVTKQSAGSKINGARVSNQVVEAWIERPDFQLMLQAVDEGVNFYHRTYPVIAQSTWAFLAFLLSRKNKQSAVDAADFLTSLATGENVTKSKTPAIYYLRQKLEELRNVQQADEKGKLMVVRMKYILTAWNHYRNNEPITKLVIEPENPRIPKPI